MRRIYAAYNADGIDVYQAYTPEIARAALAKGTFGAGFSLDRMTWIKPSFGWMLYRAGYATKPNQETILKITLMHEGFQTILSRSVESTFDPQRYADHAAWQTALAASEVRHQWDPDRHVDGRKLDRRAIQIGLRGATVRAYVNEWIVKLEDVTPLARAIHAALQNRQPLPTVPEERLYAVSDDLQQRLGIE